MRRWLSVTRCVCRCVDGETSATPERGRPARIPYAGGTPALRC